MDKTGDFNDIKQVGDMANCIYPTVAPSFKVQKSVVKADGTTWPAGETAGTTITLGTDGVATVTYRVTVTNDGTAVGKHPLIYDNLSVPPGFTITSVTLGA